MIKQIKRSFLPFMFLLVGIIVGIIYLDYYADRSTEEAYVVKIAALTGEEVEDIIHFEEDQTDVQDDILAADADFQEAVKLYSKRKYKEAELIFSALLTRFPKQITIHNYLGLLAMKGKSFTKARKHFSNSVTLDGSYYASWINLGIVNTKLHQYVDAKNAYSRAIELHPHNPKSYYNLGLLHFKSGNWDLAIPQFDSTIVKSSGKMKAKGYCYKGMALFEQNQKEEAKLALEKAIEYKPNYELARAYYALSHEDVQKQEESLLQLFNLNPRSYHANYHLGLFYKEQKSNTKAEKYLKLALEINPNDEKIIEELSSFLITNAQIEEAEVLVSGLSVVDTLPQTFFYQARLAAKKEQYKKALKLYSRAIESSNNNYPEAHMNKAILYKKMGKESLAIKNYKEAIQYKEAYPKAYYNLAVLYASQNKTKEAVKYNKLAIKFDSTSFKSWYNLGNLYENQKKYKSATKAFEQAIAVKSDYLKALAALGGVYTKRNKNIEAISVYENLLAQFPNYSKGWYNLALLNRKENQFDAAVSAYEKVLALDPENSKARMNLGVLYGKMNQMDLAISTLEEAADNDIDNPLVRYNLALQYEKQGKKKKAIHQYSKAFQLDNKHEKSIDKLITLYAENGDSSNKHIVEFYKLKLNPDAKQFYALGKVLDNDGEAEFALKAFKRVKKAGRSDHWINYWIGKSYLDLEKYDLALKYLEKSHQKKKDHKFTLYRMGQAYEYKGEGAQAAAYYEELLKLDPEFKIKTIKKTAL